MKRAFATTALMCHLTQALGLTSQAEQEAEVRLEEAEDGYVNICVDCVTNEVNYIEQDDVLGNMKTFFTAADYVGCWHSVAHWYGKKQFHIYDDFTYIHPSRRTTGEWLWNPRMASLGTEDSYTDWHLVRGYDSDGNDQMEILANHTWNSSDRLVRCPEE